MRRKKILIGIALFLILLGAGAGAVLAYRSYKIGQVRREEERLADWMITDVLPVNPIRFDASVGGNEPEWLGDTYIGTLFRTPTGARVAINALIRSSLTGTRIVRLEVYYRGGPNLEGMTAPELANAMHQNSGTQIDLPAETVYAGTPIDLKKLLPAAFGESSP